MFFLSKKIRKLMELLNSPKQPADLQEIKHAFENVAPDPARAQFQKNLRTQLMLKHKNMAKEPSARMVKAEDRAVDSLAQEPAVKTRIKDIFKWKGMPFLGKGWSFVVALLLVVTVGAFVSYPFIPAPEVQGYSLKEQARKIAYNAPIKVVFTQMMDHGSVERAFHINPTLEGRFEWSGNALMFYPQQQFQIGKVFRVSIDRSAKSIFLKGLAYDYEENFEITGPPQVVLFAPANDSHDVPTDAHLTVHFDRPMTQLTSLDQGETMVPKLEIEPKTTGKIKWLGTDSIRFIPDKLSNATHYTIKIPKGTVSAEGGQTDQDFVTSFDTLRPQLLSSTPSNWSDQNGPDTKINLTFNQIMNIGQAKSNIHMWVYKGNRESMQNAYCINANNVFDQDQCLKLSRKFQNDKNQPKNLDDIVKNFNPSQWQEVDFDANYYSVKDYQKDNNINLGTVESVSVDEKALPDEKELQKTLIVTPRQKLDYDSFFFMKVDKTFGGVEGTTTLADDVNVIFKTVGEIYVKATDFTSPSRELLFSQNMDGDSLKEHLTIDPKSFDADTKEEKKIEIGSYSTREYGIPYDFQPSTDYTLTLKAGAKDMFGKTLAKDFVVKFKTPPLSPDFEVMSAADVSVMDANKPLIFYIKTTNIDHVHINFKKLTQDEFSSFYARGYLLASDVQGPFISWEKPVQNNFNKRVIGKIDFPAETQTSLEPGYYYFDVSNPLVLDDNRGVRINRNVFIVSRTGLTAKISEKKLLVWATSFLDGAPVADMNIELTECCKSTLSGKTDKQGLVSFDLPALSNPEEFYQRQFFITGHRDNDLAFTQSGWGEGVQPYDFSLSYNGYSPKYYAYVYTDRPIYRPGHTVYLKGLVRNDQDATFKLPDVKNVHVTITDSTSTTVFEKDLPLNKNGTFSAEMMLGAQAHTGNYFISTTIPGKSSEDLTGFTQSFRIAEYRKPDYELKMESNKKDYVNGETAQIKVKASYFFGAALPNAPVDWTVRTQDYYFFLPADGQSPYASQWFSFSDEGFLCYWGCQGENSLLSQGKAKLDANGEYTINIPLDISKNKLSQFYTIEATVSDLNNQTVSNRVTVPIHAGEYYVGIRNDQEVVSAGKEAQFKIISVDSDGNSVAGKAVDVSFLKRNWNTVKKKNVDGNYYYENSYDDVFVEKKTVTTNGKGYAEVSFTPKEGGYFKAVAESKDSRGNTISSSASAYVSSSTFVNWGEPNNDRMELVPDKLEYKPGETAHILVKSPYQNVYALVTQERAEVLHHEIVKIKSNSDVIDVPITEKSIPNLYVSVVLVKGDKNDAGLAAPLKKDDIDERSISAFKVGYATLQVNTSSKKLLLDVKTNQQKYRPGDEVTLQVKSTDVNGKPVKAEVSLSVVDKSVLSLTENVTADLLNEFYRKRYLGVSTAETLTKALSRVNVQVEAGLKGGGGSDLKKRGNFKDTAYWQAVVETNDAGVGTVKFKVPDNLTTWQILSIGITSNTLVGSQKTDFLVTKDVLVRPVLPRFLIVNDEMTVSGIVHNYLDKGADFDVSLEATGVTLKNTGAQRVHLNPGEEKKVEFGLKVLNETEAKFTFKAVSTNDQNVGDIVENTMPIHPFSFPEIVATSSVINDNDKHVETVWLPSNIDTTFGKLTMTVAPTLAASITKGIEYLVQYPYGCAEQVSSALLPNLAVKQLVNLPGLGKIAEKMVNVQELQKNVEAGLQALYKYQQSNGGWGLWDTSPTSAHITSYVLFTLDEAKKAGYTVDENVMNNGTNFLKAYLNGAYLMSSASSNAVTPVVLNALKTAPANIPEKEKYDRVDVDTRAFSLYVLAEMGKGDLALSNNLFDVHQYLNLFAKTYLAMDFKLLIDQEKLDGASKNEALKKIETLKNEILMLAKETPRGVHFEEDVLDYSLFDTNTRTTALVLQMLSRIDSQNVLIPKILRYLLMEKKDGHFASTHETAVSLLSLIDYLKSSHELEPDFNGIVTVNHAEKIRKSFTQNNITDSQKIEINLTDLLPNNQDNEIVSVRDGAGKMYVDMNLKYFLPTEQIKARDEGIEVTQEYFKADDEKEEKPVTEVKVGENLKGKITVIVPEDRYYVMVEDFLPAGLEGVDFSLKTSEQDLQNKLMDSQVRNGSTPGKGYFAGDWDDWNEIWRFNHTEVRDDRMMYFADFLPKGVYEINYFVRATTPGVFHDLPTLAQETYFPEVFGRSVGRMFEVKN